MSFSNLILNIFKSNVKTLIFPYKLIFAVTYRCNSKCRTCDIWKKKIKEELTLEEIKSFLKINKFPWINLTGGEVFLRDDLVEIIKAMSNVYLLNITTNGILTDKILSFSEEINDIIPKYILAVSVDGPKELHNDIRGVNCWEKAINTYKKLKERGINSYIGHTVSPLNIDYFDKTLIDIKKVIPEFTINDFHVNFYHESELYYGNKGRLKLDKTYNEKLKKLSEKLLSKKQKSGIITNLEKRYIRIFKEYIDLGYSPISCKALSSSCFLDPYGNVYPCTFLSTKLGNIRDTKYNLKKILNKTENENIRKKIKNRKCPGCWTPCEAYQSILGNLIK